MKKSIWLSILSLVISAAGLFSAQSFADSLPAQPTDAHNPGSAAYNYTLHHEIIKVDGRDVEFFAPEEIKNTNIKAPLIVFGHGQATPVAGYSDTFVHLARKGVAVLFVAYDSGFFDQNWQRMSSDFVSLATQAVQNNFSQYIDTQKIIFSGHSKGGYIALMAAGTAKQNGGLQPSSLILFNPAGYDAQLISKVDPNIPATVIWSEADTVIKEDLIKEIYNRLPSVKKQYIKVKSYSGTTPELRADHFFMLSKHFFFGGHDGTTSFHYYGVWKWLLGAAWDLDDKGISNSYLYGDEASSSGLNRISHTIVRNWTQKFTLFNSKVSPFLISKIQAGTNELPIVVRMKDNADLSGAVKIKNRVDRIRFVYNQLVSTASKSQNRLNEMLKKKNVDHQNYYIDNSIVIQHADIATLKWISESPEVLSISINPQIKLKLPPQNINLKSFDTNVKSDVESSLTYIGAEKVWSQLGTKGKGIVVAGQDTGYDFTHPAIAKKYRGWTLAGVDHNMNWHDSIHSGFSPSSNQTCGVDLQVPCDDTGHGTHTMGTMVGNDDGRNIIGVAPEAEWIGCRNMRDGVGTAATYNECFEFFLAPYRLGGNSFTDGKPEKAPHIINNSWGCPKSEGCTGGEFIKTIEALKAAGILVVASAGNEGPDCSTIGDPPGTYSDLLVSVGAIDHSDSTATYFSSRGPSAWNGGLAPTISAPGEGIRSSVPGNKYERMSGTSMSSPHVVGAVALLWSAKPALIGDIAGTIAVLQNSATPHTTTQTCGSMKGSSRPNATYGYGILDIYTAITK